MHRWCMGGAWVVYGWGMSGCMDGAWVGHEWVYGWCMGGVWVVNTIQ